MATSNRKLNLRLEADRSAMFDVLAGHGINLESEVLQFASSKLSDDWLVAWASSIFNIRTGRSGTSGVGVAVWAELVQSIFDMKTVLGIDEQIRRLCTSSHEALDTCLVLQVAGRYVREGFSVTFEPNGEGCSDLLVENGSFRSYVEVKRENEQEHKRHMKLQERSAEILERLERQIQTWLEDRELRLEVKFSRTFSSGNVPAITDEIDRRVRGCEHCKEHELNTVANASYVLLKRLDPPHYQKGFQSGIIRVKHPGTPVELVPQNMTVRVIFDWLPNLIALKRRIQKASRQLRKDATKDPEARGFFVMQISRGEAAKDAIMDKYLPSLPSNCLGIVLISALSFVVPRSGLSTEITEIMALAAKSHVVRR